MEPTNQGEAGPVAKLGQVIQIDEGKIQAHLGEVVRSTVEETLNALLDAEADRLCEAERYERTETRKDTRAGSYQRQLHTKAGQVNLKVPKLRSLPWLLSIKLCLRDKSSGLLKKRLKHGIELRKSGGDGACPGSPATLLQRGDGESKFELQGFFRMKVTATIAAHNLQLAIDGFHDVGG